MQDTRAFSKNTISGFFLHQIMMKCEATLRQKEDRGKSPGLCHTGQHNLYPDQAPRNKQNCIVTFAS